MLERRLTKLEETFAKAEYRRRCYEHPKLSEEEIQESHELVRQAQLIYEHGALPEGETMICTGSLTPFDMAEAMKLVGPALDWQEEQAKNEKVAT